MAVLAWIAASALAAVDVTDVMAPFGMAERWEPSRMVYVFSGRQHRAELMPGSAQVLFDGRFVELSEPICLRNGCLRAPNDLGEAIARLLPQRPRPQPSGKIPRLKLERIMLDPGHGGRDPGAVDHGVREKDVTLAICQALGEALQRRGWTAAYTRSDDTFVDLDARADMTNRFQADVFVSVHANSASSKAADGYETYHVDNGYDNIERGIEAAREYDFRPGSVGMDDPPSAPMSAVLLGAMFEEYKHESRELAAAIQAAVGQVAQSRDRGVKPGPWRVVREANCANCLVEVGFVSNASEAARLANPFYRQQLAAAIADGIEQFRKSFIQTNGFTQ